MVNCRLYYVPAVANKKPVLVSGAGYKVVQDNLKPIVTGRDGGFPGPTALVRVWFVGKYQSVFGELSHGTHCAYEPYRGRVAVVHGDFFKFRSQKLIGWKLGAGDRKKCIDQNRIQDYDNMRFHLLTQLIYLDDAFGIAGTYFHWETKAIRMWAQRNSDR